jgi:hypothetical protein
MAAILARAALERAEGPAACERLDAEMKHYLAMFKRETEDMEAILTLVEPILAEDKTGTMTVGEALAIFRARGGSRQ